MTDDIFAATDLTGSTPSPGHEDENVTDNVTRSQGGQFIDEGQEMIRVGDPLENLHDVAPEAKMVDSGTGSVNALQVTMDRSGADFIHAQKVFLTNAGAKQITGTSSKLIQSGVLTLQADSAEFHQSSAVFASAGTMTVDQGTVISASAKEAHLGEGTQVSLLQAGSVRADGDIRAFMVVGGNVSAGGNVSSTLTTNGAAAFGAAFGIVLLVLSKLLGRKR